MAAGEQRVENIVDARLKDVVQRCRKTQLDGYANKVKKNKLERDEMIISLTAV